MNRGLKKVIISTMLLCVTYSSFSQNSSEGGVTPKSTIDIWNLPEMEVSPGPYEANWESLSKYEVPDWFRDAKLGIWSHWCPQSVPEMGGWYARWMYIEGDYRYNHCLETYGHPSQFGYKDLCALWSCEDWDPDFFVGLAVDTGGKYFVGLANHHDNYDCWDSTYQPWNSVNIGPKKDVIGIWKEVADKYNLPFGVSVHASPARTLGQFMPYYFNADKEGEYKDIPYDAAANLTIEDGKGKAWEGLDPKDLYGFKHNIRLDCNQTSFATQFMWRVDDLLKYNPDLLYFDESVGGNGYVDLGVKMGFDHLAPQIAANFYNKSLSMNGGENVAVLNIKAVGGVANSLSTKEEADIVAGSLVKDSERIIEGNIEPYPFQTDDALGGWFPDTRRQSYKDARWAIHALINNVSKNGNLLLGITQRAQGGVDKQEIEICREIGAWLEINGEGIYKSRPYEVFKAKDSNIYFTRADGNIYAFLLDCPKERVISIPELRAGGATIGNISKVEILGGDKDVDFSQTKDDFTVIIGNENVNDIAITLKIYQDKRWINDDDPGVKYWGWRHLVNRDMGEFNNDVYISRVRGERCSYNFEGSQIKLITNVGIGLGKLQILIDGVYDATVDLSKNINGGVQQLVYTSKKLNFGKHKIDVINCSDDLVMIDAFEVVK